MSLLHHNGLLAYTACVWEATARKPGNVHRYRDFEDSTYLDFVLSAAAIAPVFDRAAERPVGETVLEAVRATRAVVSTNTNLGIVLLLAPLAAVPPAGDLPGGVGRLLDRLDVADSRAVYEAIRLARPGGLGQASSQDVSGEPALPLRNIMHLAAERDAVARQYANGYREVFGLGVPEFRHGLEIYKALENAVIHTHLHLLAQVPDTLIARKCGAETAEAASRRAREALELGAMQSAPGRAAIEELDAWLCGAGHRRNPGTTADLVAASLFVALRQGIMTLPPSLPWSAGPSP